VASQNFGAQAVEYAQKALAADPKLYQAREVMAHAALEDNNEDKAREEANKALAISPEALDAMSILATVDWLDDKPVLEPPGEINTASPWIDRIFKINPHYGEAYETAGYFFVINRRYTEGIKYYRKAIEVEPKLWSARSQLGINLMRLGDNQEARKLLVECFDNGFQDQATSNTLKLLDSYKNFETYKTPSGRGVLKLATKEAPLLEPYFAAQLDKDLADYDKKYKYKIPGEVQVEVYPNHEDFAVRTMGMPGLGALGVTFGNIVAMDSPSGRKPGEFHWASTMRHELSHVYVLSMTNHRVPRWFTEGLAVYEETADSPDWGDRLDHESIVAIRDKKLLPIAELDRGFVHPSYPSQVIVSYFQGGQIISYIVEKWGYDKILAMIHDFGDRMTTVDVIQKELGLKPEEFDKQFLPWLEAKTKTTVDGFETWAKTLKAINQSAKAKDWDAVIKQGTAIRDIYPDYVDAGSVYEFLAQAYLAKGDKANAIAQLKRYSDVGGRDPDTLKKLATLETEAGRKQVAATVLERLNWIYLEDDQAHQMLGDLDLGLGKTNEAIREYRAVLAGKPIDQAGAHYQLARALNDAHQTEAARDEVLSALEAAPEFRPAQKLLLELTAKTTK
jgi:tetratricopeptide (TPR) repeat protein